MVLCFNSIKKKNDKLGNINGSGYVPNGELLLNIPAKFVELT